MQASRISRQSIAAATAVLATALLMTGCARPGRELKAPCAPLGYAEDAACGLLKPANATPFERVVEDE
ncbi:hypothetical protein [Mesorhizobium sp. Mes31]|uniref:hypothetical protein n=1 Tax=Mesorhizobium sp. Mes31 TaxID=2926017 RepID=UPI002118637D|nr:hypothetical protein [Mesorhizobium sp. Mes31]